MDEVDSSRPLLVSNSKTGINFKAKEKDKLESAIKKEGLVMPTNPEDYLDEMLKQIKKDSKELKASQEVSEDYFSVTSPSHGKGKETTRNLSDKTENKDDGTLSSPSGLWPFNAPDSSNNTSNPSSTSSLSKASLDGSSKYTEDVGVPPVESLDTPSSLLSSSNELSGNDESTDQSPALEYGQPDLSSKPPLSDTTVNESSGESPLGIPKYLTEALSGPHGLHDSNESDNRDSSPSDTDQKDADSPSFISSVPSTSDLPTTSSPTISPSSGSNEHAEHKSPLDLFSPSDDTNFLSSDLTGSADSPSSLSKSSSSFDSALSDSSVSPQADLGNENNADQAIDRVSYASTKQDQNYIELGLRESGLGQSKASSKYDLANNPLTDSPDLLADSAVKSAELSAESSDSLADLTNSDGSLTGSIKRPAINNNVDNEDRPTQATQPAQANRSGVNSWSMTSNDSQENYSQETGINASEGNGQLTHEKQDQSDTSSKAIRHKQKKVLEPDSIQKHGARDADSSSAHSYEQLLKPLYPPLKEPTFNLGEYDTRGFKQQHQRFDETFVADEDISFYRKGVRHEFFLELDNRTETNGAIVDKIVNYVNYARNNPDDEILMEVAYADGSVSTKKYGKYSPIPKKISNFLSRFLESSIADQETGEMYYIPTLLQHTPNLRVSISEVSESHQDPADFLNDKCYLLDALSTVHKYVDYINSQRDYDWDCTFKESPEFTYLKNKILSNLSKGTESNNDSSLDANSLIPRDAGSGSFYKRSNRYLKGIWKAVDDRLVSSYLPHIGTITYSHRLDFKTYKQNVIFGIEHDLDTAVQFFAESASTKKQKDMAAPLVIFPTRERPLYALNSANTAKMFYWPAVWQPSLPLFIQPVFSLDTDKRLRDDLWRIMEQYKTSIYRYFLTGGLNKSDLKNGKKYEQDYLPSFYPNTGDLRLGDLLGVSENEKEIKKSPKFAKNSVLTNGDNSNSRSRSYEELRLLAQQTGDADSFIKQLKVEEVPISVYKALLSRWPSSSFSPELIVKRDYIEYDIYTPPKDAELDSIPEHVYYPNSALPFARIKPFE